MRKSVKLKEVDRTLQENRKLKNENRKLIKENSVLMDENIRLRRMLYIFAKAGFKDKTIPGWYFYEVMDNDK